MLRYIFPGLGGLFQYGRWSFLAITVAFFLALDLLLIAHFYWTDCLTPQGRYTSVIAFFLLWFLLAQISGYCEKMLLRRRAADSKRNFFADAQMQYLQGNWFEAECFLNEILKRNPRDPEALLMLATLFRHTNRFEESRKILQKLQNFDEAKKWFVEIENELNQMKTH
ncbi:MAG: tetratricopeptide repeat protein [Planctomycetaceae bacterium]|nr:tetratricopeptide repeat protein [Planctomycetaceae bacterium]